MPAYGLLAGTAAVKPASKLPGQVTHRRRRRKRGLNGPSCGVPTGRQTNQPSLRSPKPYNEHATDRGYNAIAFTNAANVWVNQVTVANADTAISLRWVDHATLLGEAACQLASRAKAPVPIPTLYPCQGARATVPVLCIVRCSLRLMPSSRALARAHACSARPPHPPKHTHPSPLCRRHGRQHSAPCRLRRCHPAAPGPPGDFNRHVACCAGAAVSAFLRLCCWPLVPTVLLWQDAHRCLCLPVARHAEVLWRCWLAGAACPCFASLHF